MTPWSPQSWRERPIRQQPTYTDAEQVRAIEARLATLPPLVAPDEIVQLSSRLAEVERGRAFLLQGGDCAETFAHLSEQRVRSSFGVLLQIALTLVHRLGRPVVKVGRIAGQYAKPRSQELEERDGVQLPVYRGDMVNGSEFDASTRAHDPTRLLNGYFHSAATLNHLRALARSGYGHLDNAGSWARDVTLASDVRPKYAKLVEATESQLRFARACGLGSAMQQAMGEVEFYTSHEALLLNYEAALVRPAGDRQFATSGHLLWVGNRTRQLDEAHIEFMRGLANPLGVKFDEKTELDEILRLLDRLNPDNEPGRITLISRMGVRRITDALPPLIHGVLREGRRVVWSCDPMHGNTFVSQNALKTRRFDDIYGELRAFFRIHRELGSVPGGIHLELTGQDVTECIGGSQSVLEENLDERYETQCDPRLNANQSLELAFLVAEELAMVDRGSSHDP